MPALMKSLTDQTTDPKTSPQRSPVPSQWGRRVGMFIFLGLATALHGLAFVVPWPDAEPVEAPETEVVLEPELPAISVSQLPPDLPEPASLASETAKKSTLPNQAAQASPRQTPTNQPSSSTQKPAAATPETEEVNKPNEAENLNLGDHPPEAGTGQLLVQDVMDQDLLTANPENGTELRNLQQKFTKEAANSQSISEDEVVQNLSPTQRSLLICDSELDSNFLPKKILVGIMLDPANTDIRYGPQVMASSGSQQLDNLAKEETEKAIATLAPEHDVADWHKAYFILFTVDTDTSNCPSS